MVGKFRPSDSYKYESDGRNFPTIIMYLPIQERHYFIPTCIVLCSVPLYHCTGVTIRFNPQCDMLCAGCYGGQLLYAVVQ